jgi:uncharacterized iron-regulated membrane protein
MKGFMHGVMLRRLAAQVHRYAGLTVGLFIVILGVSGSVAVYWNELTQFFSPQYRIAAPADRYAPLQDVMNALHAAHPDRKDPWSVDYPFAENRHAPAWAVYEEPEERSGVHESPLYVAINPYTAEIIGEFYWGDTPVSWIFNVHSVLAIQSSDIGEQIVGVVGFMLFLMSVSGIYLWWPAGRFTRRQFMATPAGSGRGFEFELHKLAGFYISIVFLVVSVTGMIIVWPLEAAKAVGAIRPLNMPLIEEYETPHVTRRPGVQPVPFDAVLEKARALFPGAEFRHALMPSPGGTEAYGVTLRQPQERFDRMYPETKLWMDQYSGEVIEVVDATEFNFSRSLLGYNRYAFHNGSALGEAGRFVVFLAGLLPLFLYVTGIRQWLRLRRRVAGPAP